MNTPDTKRSVEEIVQEFANDSKVGGDYLWEVQQESLRHALSSRDTYWKERVRKEVEGMKMKEAEKTDQPKMQDEKVYDEGWNQALDTLLDNLK